jgi:DNA-binding winged helix-turn-helix (wHTH) protein/TolB-like protein/Tfp pilus assembly protein PilF
MGDNSQHFYEFGRFRLVPYERLLLRDQEIVPLTPKVFEILLVLVQSSGQVISKDGLMKKVWPDSFVEEGNLTQNISLLRKALGEGQNGLQYIETVARRGYRFVAPVREATEDDRYIARNNAGSVEVSRGVETGAGRKDDSGLSQKVHSQNLILSFSNNRRALVLSVLGLLAIVLGIVYLTRDSKAVNSSGVIESIAVLPFVNEAQDTDAEYFTDEITESLVNNLSQLPKLRVVPRSVVMNYRGIADPRKIARDLNVRAVLTGRVHRRGDTLSIQVDLIDATSVAQMWGQHYDRRVSDILLVQEDISRDIFENLRLKLSVEEQKQLEAFSLYLKGRNAWNKRTEDGLLQGIEYFRKAIEVDQSYAPAYAGLADCYNMLVVYGLSQPKESFPKAKEAATKALSIDGTLAEARTSLAFIKHRWDWSREEAEREFQLAIKYKPGYAPAHQWYSSYLVAMGRFDEAIDQARRAQELEPLSFIGNSHLGWILYLAGKNDEAIAHCRRLLDVDPNFFPAHRYMGLAYEQKGMLKEAIDEFEQGVKLSGSPLMLSLLGHAYAASGKKKDAYRILADLDQQKQRYVSPYTIATIYAGLGDKDQAFRLLEKAFEERDIWLMNLKVDPVLTSLRSDQRFKDLLQRIGLAP